jgi:hypothetical protein
MAQIYPFPEIDHVWPLGNIFLSKYKLKNKFEVHSSLTLTLIDSVFIKIYHVVLPDLAVAPASRAGVPQPHVTLSPSTKPVKASSRSFCLVKRGNLN